MSKAHSTAQEPTEQQNMKQSSDVIEETTSPSAIWTAEERAVLQKSIEGYRNAPKNKKASFIAQKVVPEIKLKWKGRYSKKIMLKDSVGEGRVGCEEEGSELFGGHAARN